MDDDTPINGHLHKKALKIDNTYTFEIWQDSKVRQVHQQTKI